MRTFPTVLVPAVLALAPVTPSRAATPQWTWRASAPVQFQRLTLLGTLLVSTADGLTALDPARGAVAWTRDDVRRLKAPDFEELPDTRYGLLHLGEGAGGLKRRVELIDLTTGARLWDTRTLPIASVHGAFPALQRDMVVLVGSATERRGTVVLGVDLASGALRWRQDALFASAVKLRRVAGSGGALFRAQLDGDMPALFDGPDRMILWVSEDGPLALDLATGRRIWGSSIEGPAPSRAIGCAPWRLEGRTLFAPFGRTLQAIDARSGVVLWHTDPPFAGVVGRMQLTRSGLVVQGTRVRREHGETEGRPFLDLLDPAAGTSRWLRPPTGLEDASPFVALGDTLYVAADRHLLAVALADGTTRTVASLALEGHETVTGLEAFDGDLLATSSQTEARLSRQGEKRYERYDPAPTAPAWLRTAAVLEAAAANAQAIYALATAGDPLVFTYRLMDITLDPRGPRVMGLDPVLTRRYKASREAGAHRVVLTYVEEDGRRGVGLLKIEKASGQVQGSLMLGDRTPDLAYDPIEGRLFFVRDGREIACYGF